MIFLSFFLNCRSQTTDNGAKFPSNIKTFLFRLEEFEKE